MSAVRFGPPVAGHRPLVSRPWIERIHDAHYSFRSEQLDGIGRLQYRRLDNRTLVLIPTRQDVIGQFASRVPATNADPQTRNALGAERGDDRRQSVMPAVGTLLAHPQSPKRQIHVVGNNKHVREFYSVVASEFGHGSAAQIHERERLDQQNSVAKPAESRDQGRRSCPLELGSMTRRHQIDNREADVVSRVLI